jgi:hypothetical protein
VVISGVNGFFLQMSLAHVQYVIPDRHRLCCRVETVISFIGGISERLVLAYEIRIATSQTNINNRDSLSRGYVSLYIHLSLTPSLLIYIYIYAAPCKVRNFNVVYIWTYIWQR